MTLITRRRAAILAVAVIVTATSLAGSTFAQSTPTSNQLILRESNHTVSVNGTGTITVSPDTATSDVGVETRGETAREAQQKNSDQTTKLTDGLKAIGIARDDIKTSWYNVYPQYDYSKEGVPPKLTGYTASHNLSIKIRDLAKVSIVLDKVTELGATSVSGVNYTVEKKSAAVDSARELAAKDARAKADKLGKAFGFRVGTVTSVSEMSDTGMVYPMASGVAMDAKAEATPVQPGTIDVTVNVSVSYDIN